MGLIILFIFLTAVFVSFLHDHNKKVTSTLMILIISGIVYYFCTYHANIVQGNTLVQEYQWFSELNINLSFYLDGLSLFFSLLVSFLGLLIVIYAIKYMSHYPHQGRFFGYLLFFMGSMLGVVLSANLISLFIFWELTSLSSFFLIGFNNKEKKSRYAARQALLITSGGGLALMAGFILINVITGSYQLQEILNNPAIFESEPLVITIIILILAGAFTKSAQFPFHFWLPNAMAAPTPVSAYLHSATMVKAGVYLVFRFNPLFKDIPLWHDLLLYIGSFTMVFSAYKAFQADDMKRILAFTTMSALAIFFMMIGVGTEEAVGAAILYVLAHAFYKGGLFLIAGNLDHETGTRKISALSGLGKKMPFTAFAGVIASFSMAGIFPTVGFVGKEALYESLHHEGTATLLYLILLILASAFFVVVTILIGYKVFFSPGQKPEKSVHEANPMMYIPPLILAIGGLLFGFVPASLLEPLLDIAANDIYGEQTVMKLKLWHGFNLVFWLSLGTIILGLILYFIRPYFVRIKKGFDLSKFISADRIYSKLIDGVGSLSVHQTTFIQNGYLRNYILIYIVLFIGLIFLKIPDLDFNQLIVNDVWQNLGLFEVAILILIITAIVILFISQSRLIVVATLSIIGYGIALAYTLFSAPDVAMTQFLAETLTLIFLIIILHRLPRYVITKYKVNRKYLVTSVVFGLLMTGISLVMLSRDIDSELKTYFLNESVPKGKGENVVNVILVDFRALDTMGEITVLGITMIGIISLLKLKPRK